MVPFRACHFSELVIPSATLCDNRAYTVIPIPQPRERSESWTPMVRSESDLKSENLALSTLKAVRDSSSSAKKSGGLLGMTAILGSSHRLPGRGLPSRRVAQTLTSMSAPPLREALWSAAALDSRLSTVDCYEGALNVKSTVFVSLAPTLTCCSCVWPWPPPIAVQAPMV